MAITAVFRWRSRDKESIIKEAELLSKSGVKELILIAQDLTMYGTDLYGGQKLHELLRELSKVEGIEWIRLLYCYPEEIYDELIDEIANNNKVVKYLDILIVLCITILIYNNIISNQQDNLKLLKILGYNSYKIKKIIYVDLLAITLIGWIIGIILLCFLTKLIKMEINIISSIIINVLTYTIALIISKKNIH